MEAKERLDQIIKNIEEDIEEKIDLDFVDSDEFIARYKDGKVIISKGCVNKLNDDELAFIVCHEFVHGKRGHIDESDELLNECAESVTNSLNKIWDSESGFFKKLAGSVLVGAIGYTGTKIRVRSMSRDHEYDADKMAVEIMEKAGYDTNGARSFFSKYCHTDQGFIGNLFSTHPTGQRRLGNIS